MKPTNSSSQGQPNPTKIRLKVALGPLFPCEQIIFLGLGLIVCRKQTTRNPTQPNFSANTLPWLIETVFYVLGPGWWLASVKRCRYTQYDRSPASRHAAHGMYRPRSSISFYECLLNTRLGESVVVTAPQERCFSVPASVHNRTSRCNSSVWRL